jgi:hypothetical protein
MIVGLVTSLVDVVHDLYDNLNFAFGVQNNAIHRIVRIRICGIHFGDDIHLGQASMVSVANEELQVLEEFQCGL